MFGIQAVGSAIGPFFCGMIADKWGLPLDGGWLWQWKDRIDRTFMQKFADYPPMPRDLPTEAALGLDEAMGPKPLCGGCGAKLGAADLAAALAAASVKALASAELSLGADTSDLGSQPKANKRAITERNEIFIVEMNQRRLQTPLSGGKSALPHRCTSGSRCPDPCCTE